MLEVDGIVRVSDDGSSLMSLVIDVITMLDAVFIAFHVVEELPNNASPGDYMTVELTSVGKTIRLPVAHPFALAVAEKRPSFIDLTIEDASDPPPYSKWTGGLQSVAMHAIKPAFVAFYESMKPKISAKYGRTRNWPPGLLFLKTVRNAISHDGTVRIQDSNEAASVWRGARYDQSDNGRQIIGTELTLGDLLVLMLDVHAEITSW